MFTLLWLWRHPYEEESGEPPGMLYPRAYFEVIVELILILVAIALFAR